MSADTTTTNRYLEGPFAPVSEELTAFDLRVSGTLPADLDGRYLRIGPNPVGPVDPASYHWFTGEGMVHGVRLRDGKAEWYRNRWVRSAPAAAALGEPDRGGPHHSNSGDTAVNTNVVGLAGRTFALVEAGSYPIELTDELETIARNNFDGTLTGAYTAHPKVHGATGELHAITYWWPEESVHHIVVGTDGRVRRDVEVPLDGRVMVHDTAVSATRVVVLDLPVTFDLDRAMAGVAFPYRWEEERPARVGLLPIDGAAGDIVWCSVDPCYVFHPANAVDLADGSLQLDVVRHPSMFRTELNGPDEGAPALVRWTVDPASGKVHERQLDDLPVEFPRFDDRRAGRDYRYAYTTSISFTDGRDGALVRYDVSDQGSGGRTMWRPGPGRTCGEFVFVPRDGSPAEDDGWLLGLVHDVDGGASELAVLAADDVAAGPVATVALPGRVPLGFHGNWVPTT